MAATAQPTPTELTTLELALLALTNPRELLPTAGLRLALTTKESYLWATFLAVLAEAELQIEPRRLVDAIQEETKSAHIEEVQPGYSLRVSSGAEIMKRLAKRLLVPPPQDVDLWFEGIVQNSDDAYSGLVGRGLIEDPLTALVAGVAVAVIGLVPVSFTRQTEAGEQVLMRIKSLFFEYEQSLDGEATNVNIRFHLMRLLRAFYSAATSGFAESWAQVEKDTGTRTKDRGENAARRRRTEPPSRH